MRRIVPAVIVVAVLAVGGFAYAEAQPADPSVLSLREQPGPTAGRGAGAPRSGGAWGFHPPETRGFGGDPGTGPRRGGEAADVQATPDATQARPARMLQGAIHGELLVRERESQGSTRTVVFDRGRLTSVSESLLTLERPDGVLVTARVTPETRFAGTPRTELQPGTAVLVVQSSGTAERVLSKGTRSEERPRPRRRAEAGTF
jgi:hypothetical protein